MKERLMYELFLLTLYGLQLIVGFLQIEQLCRTILITFLCTSTVIGRRTLYHSAILRPDDHKAVDSEPSSLWQGSFDSFDVFSTSQLLSISSFFFIFHLNILSTKLRNFFHRLLLKQKMCPAFIFLPCPNDSCLLLYINTLFSGNLQALSNHQNA